MFSNTSLYYSGANVEPWNFYIAAGYYQIINVYYNGTF